MPPFDEGDLAVRCHEIDYEIFGDDMQIVEIELDPNETVVAEAGAMNYMEEGIEIDYDIQAAGSLKSMFFGGEGLFLASLSGVGTVLLQSLPFSRLADRVIQHAPSAGGSSKGEGSVLGGLGNLFGD